jgi:hypothetical protein
VLVSSGATDIARGVGVSAPTILNIHLAGACVNAVQGPPHFGDILGSTAESIRTAGRWQVKVLSIGPVA